jgi:hypothetical protein
MAAHVSYFRVAEFRHSELCAPYTRRRCNHAGGTSEGGGIHDDQIVRHPPHPRLVYERSGAPFSSGGYRGNRPAHIRSGREDRLQPKTAWLSVNHSASEYGQEIGLSFARENATYNSLSRYAITPAIPAAGTKRSAPIKASCPSSVWLT